MTVRVIIGVDVGIGGAIAVMVGDSLAIIDAPTKLIKVTWRGRKVDRAAMDPEALYSIFAPFKGQDVTCGLERVFAKPREQPQRAFNFGEGYGYYKMAAIACGMKLVEMTPPTWKKAYPQLSDKSDRTAEMKDELKALRAQSRSLKDEGQLIGIRKEIEGLNRRLKEQAKDAARTLAAKLYPQSASYFKRKKDDGRAEAVLIARYVKELQT